MRATVKLLDGEEIEGELGQPVRLDDALEEPRRSVPSPSDWGVALEISDPDSNTTTALFAYAATKYVIIHGVDVTRPAAEGDPREKEGHKKVILHFRDGETIRTYDDDNFFLRREGLTMRVWEPSSRSLVQVIASLHGLKGVFYVKEWETPQEPAMSARRSPRAGR